MNNESLTESDSKRGGDTVIKPWLSGGLVLALVGSCVLSGVLILQLSTFEEAKRQAQEAEAATAKARTELAVLQNDVESLTKQKDALAPTIADWEKRIKEKALAEAALATLDGKKQEAEAATAKARTELAALQNDVESLTKQKNALAPTIADWEKRIKEKALAEAALATLDGKKRQTESDISQDARKLEEVNLNLVSAKKDQAELNSEIQKLRAELLSLTKTKTDAKAVLALAIAPPKRGNGFSSVNETGGAES